MMSTIDQAVETLLDTSGSVLGRQKVPESIIGSGSGSTTCDQASYKPCLCKLYYERT
jgi:hypothetical protein